MLKLDALYDIEATLIHTPYFSDIRHNVNGFGGIGDSCIGSHSRGAFFGRNPKSPHSDHGASKEPTNPRFVISDHSDHGASKKPTNPHWTRIRRFL